jgi:hypothetical protein
VMPSVLLHAAPASPRAWRESLSRVHGALGVRRLLERLVVISLRKKQSGAFDAFTSQTWHDDERERGRRGARGNRP